VKGNTYCLYLCKKHIVELFLFLQFGDAVAEMLPSHAGTCNYCKNKDSLRVFVYEDHYRVNEWVKIHGLWKP